MTPISYAAAGFPVRDDIAASHNRFWNRMANAGTWFNAELRVAIAAEVRAAYSCVLCRERKAALSPTHVSGVHDHTGALTDLMVEVIHRVTTDPGRLTKSWFDDVITQGLSEGEYVEIIGTLVALVSIDDFCFGIGVPLNPLPEPRDGEPSRYTPEGLGMDSAWVPTIGASKVAKAESDLWEPGRIGNVIRAMSLVPDEVRTLNDLGDVHYVPKEQMMNCRGAPRGTLSRLQIEIIASRVSARNGCFY